MAGLLGDSWDDPRTQATLQLAAGLLGGGNFGQALGRGLGGYQQSMSAAQEAKMRKEEMDWKRQEISAKQAQAQETQALKQRQAEWLASQAPADPTGQMYLGAAKSGIIGAGDYFKQMTPKEEEAFTLGEGQVRYKGGNILAQGPQKQAEQPSAVREYEYARGQGYNGTFEQFQTAQKRATAPSVAVNMSDPTAVARAALGFQKDYRDATKSSFSRATAYNSMEEAAKSPSAKGDLTMVYSFVKALDPDSVVREGEIDLVNANRNIPDKIKGYAQKLATGQSLLPNERQDLINQARTLARTDYQRSRNDIKAFRDNASRLGLDPELYAPDPYRGIKFDNGAASKVVAKTGVYNGKKVIQYTDGSVEYAN